VPSSGQVGIGMPQRWQPSPRVLSPHRFLPLASSPQSPGSACHPSLGTPNQACTPSAPPPSSQAPQPQPGGTPWGPLHHSTGERTCTMRSGQVRDRPTPAPAGAGAPSAPCPPIGSMPHMACSASRHHSTGPLTSCSATHHPPPAFPLTTLATQPPNTLPGAPTGLSPSTSTWP
jgi:hypothetical protein